LYRDPLFLATSKISKSSGTICHTLASTNLVFFGGLTDNPNIGGEDREQHNSIVGLKPINVLSNLNIDEGRRTSK
jgi:hypothetical protein